MPYGFSMWDLDRRLAVSNPRYLDIYSYRAEDIHPGMNLLDLCRLSIALGNHPGLAVDELHDIYQRRFDAAQSGEPLFSEKAIRGKLIRTTHTFLPGTGWVIRHEDVTDATERQWLADLKEKALAKQDQRFAAAVNNMPQGLCMFDANERLVVCNRHYADLYGRSSSIASPTAWCPRVAPKPMSRAAGPWSKTAWSPATKSNSRTAAPSPSTTIR
jgi:PAS domain-containing protein